MVFNLISCRLETLLPLTRKANPARVAKESCRFKLLREGRKNWDLRMIVGKKKFFPVEDWRIFRRIIAEAFRAARCQVDDG
jgi:hypothetical protein